MGDAGQLNVLATRSSQNGDVLVRESLNVAFDDGSVLERQRCRANPAFLQQLRHSLRILFPLPRQQCRDQRQRRESSHPRLEYTAAPT